jgi:hypothetical protein
MPGLRFGATQASQICQLQAMLPLQPKARVKEPAGQHFAAGAKLFLHRSGPGNRARSREPTGAIEARFCFACCFKVVGLRFGHATFGLCLL